MYTYFWVWPLSLRFQELPNDFCDFSKILRSFRSNDNYEPQWFVLKFTIQHLFLKSNLLEFCALPIYYFFLLRYVVFNVTKQLGIIMLLCLRQSDVGGSTQQKALIKLLWSVRTFFLFFFFFFFFLFFLFFYFYLLYLTQ